MDRESLEQAEMDDAEGRADRREHEAEMQARVEAVPVPSAIVRQTIRDAIDGIDTDIRHTQQSLALLYDQVDANQATLNRLEADRAHLAHAYQLYGGEL